MIGAFIHLVLFTLFMFFSVLGLTGFLIVQSIRKNPGSAMYWAGVIRRIFGF